MAALSSPPQIPVVSRCVRQWIAVRGGHAQLCRCFPAFATYYALEPVLFDVYCTVVPLLPATAACVLSESAHRLVPLPILPRSPSPSMTGLRFQDSVLFLVLPVSVFV